MPSHRFTSSFFVLAWLQPLDGAFIPTHLSVGAPSPSPSHRRNVLKSIIKADADQHGLDQIKCSAMRYNPDGDCINSSVLPSSTINRRRLVGLLPLSLVHPTKAHAIEQAPPLSLSRGKVIEIEDVNSYSGVVFIPPAKKTQQVKSFPLLVVLHGAGSNQHSALHEFTQEGGDHTNLPPYLLSSNQAPSTLSENFVVVAPYVGKNKRSLYDDPRSKILSFIKWFNTWLESQTLEDGTNIAINRQRVSLFGFSEGSTLAVELATTGQFNGVVCASYGFTGILPKVAVQRLVGQPIWVFHSKGDDIYDIKCSNQLVESLITYQGGTDVFDVGDVVKYTKLIPQNNAAKGYEHVRSSLVASKSDEVFTWILSLQ